MENQSKNNIQKSSYFGLRWSMQHSPFCILSMALSTPSGTPLSSASPTMKLTSRESNNLPPQLPSRCTVTQSGLTLPTEASAEADYNINPGRSRVIIPLTHAPSLGLRKPSPLTLILRTMPPSSIRVSPSNFSSSICWDVLTFMRHATWSEASTRIAEASRRLSVGTQNQIHHEKNK